MAAIIFIASTIVVGAAMSFIDVDAGTSRRDTPDYRLVPYSGDAFGA